MTDAQSSLQQRVVDALGDQYEIECEIGRGGMSVVYRARDRRLDLVKLRSSGLQSAFTDVSSATQEVRSLSRDIDVMLAAANEVRGL